MEEEKKNFPAKGSVTVQGMTLKSIRINARKTQLETATALGYKAVSPYQRIENGNRKLIRPEMLCQLAVFFDVPLEEMIEAIKRGEQPHEQPRQIRVRTPRSAG